MGYASCSCSDVLRLKLTIDSDMKWVLIMFTVNFCARYVIEAGTGDVIVMTSNLTYNLQNLDTLGGPVKYAPPASSRGNTRFDDVTDMCTTIDDVTAARRFLCPAHCRCSPLGGHEVLTTLTVNCSDTKFNQSTSLKFNQELTQLLSQCVSELMELNITNTPLATVPQVVCQLSKIQWLRLDSNQLASLPGNCFTRMHNLKLFSADNNRLTSLQVS